MHYMVSPLYKKTNGNQKMGRGRATKLCTRLISAWFEALLWKRAFFNEKHSVSLVLSTLHR